jgi:hypothetical protein
LILVKKKIGTQRILGREFLDRKISGRKGRKRRCKMCNVFFHSIEDKRGQGVES